MKTYLTRQQIIEDIVSKMTDQDIADLKTLQESDMIKFHHGVGTFIRNTYGLWEHGNPLTQLWIIDNEAGNTEFIKNGVDYHPCHPDEISMQILVGVWKSINGQGPSDIEITKEEIEEERRRENVRRDLKQAMK